MTTILLADDHRIVREGLCALLEQKERLTVVANVSNGPDALEHALKLNPDIAILDITMPEMNGIEVSRRLQSERPSIHVIILSMHADREFVIESLRAGAKGYVLKDSAFRDLRLAIRTVQQGGIYLSPQITPVVVDAAIHSPDSAELSPFTLLSPREREVLQMIAEGIKTRDIALSLIVSEKTVETHRRNIMEKLDLRSVAELTKYAVRHGLTDID
ncbi:response regulator transcription factor [bacterium]|nr:response regulator transcription factor [candidate division CSSED10-310 bacterium]